MDKQDLILEKLTIIENRLGILLDRVESEEARGERASALLNLLTPLAGAWLSGMMAQQGARHGAHEAASDGSSSAE